MNGLALIKDDRLQTVIRDDVSKEYIRGLEEQGFVVVPDDQVPDGTVTESEDQRSREDVLAGGYLDQPSGIRLRATEADQNRYGNLCALCQITLQGGQLTMASRQSIKDYEGTVREMSVAELFGLMARYGLWCKTVFDQYQGKDQ